MSATKPTNVAASITAKLKNVASRDRVDFQNVLTRYGIERFLYRLSRSEHAERFVLKGASLFVVWQGQSHRATRDLDLLSFGASDVDSVISTFKAIIEWEAEPDALIFDSSQTRAVPIKEGQKYRGVRLMYLTMEKRPTLFEQSRPTLSMFLVSVTSSFDLPSGDL